MSTNISNYAFGAIPKSDFLKVLIDNIHYNIDDIIEAYKKIKTVLIMYTRRQVLIIFL